MIPTTTAELKTLLDTDINQFKILAMEHALNYIKDTQTLEYASVKEIKDMNSLVIDIEKSLLPTAITNNLSQNNISIAVRSLTEKYIND